MAVTGGMGLEGIPTWTDGGKKKKNPFPNPQLLSDIQVTGISELGISELDQCICPDAVSGSGQYQYVQRKKIPCFWKNVPM